MVARVSQLYLVQGFLDLAERHFYVTWSAIQEGGERAA